MIEQILTPATFAPTAAPAVPAAPTFHVLPVVLALIWLAGATAVLTWWWRQWRIVRLAVRNATAVDLSPACDTSGILAVASPLMLEPGVVGIRRPVLVLPEGLADRLTHGQLRALVAHYYKTRLLLQRRPPSATEQRRVDGENKVTAGAPAGAP